MKTILTSVIVVAVGVLVGLDARAADSDEPVVQTFNGTYQLATSPKKARKHINEAIEEVVSEMSFIKRPFARDALREKTTPCPTVAVVFPPDKISVTCGDRPPAVSPENDALIAYKAADGNTYKLRQKRSGRVVRQVFISEAGKRTNTLILAKDGESIEMKVRLESSQLPRPLDYSLTFKQ